MLCSNFNGEYKSTVIYHYKVSYHLNKTRMLTKSERAWRSPPRHNNRVQLIDSIALCITCLLFRSPCPITPNENAPFLFKLKLSIYWNRLLRDLVNSIRPKLAPLFHFFDSASFACDSFAGCVFFCLKCQQLSFVSMWFSLGVCVVRYEVSQ